MRRIYTGILIISLLRLQLAAAQPQPYMPGEKVTYQIKYGPVGSGVLTLEIKDGFYKGEPVWHATVTGQTTGLADALYM